jgi:eukaryotic-like serine/threonine-protein kinase
VVSQAGAGLTVLHGQGSIHRDLEPANLLLRTDGPGTRVMVADLGVDERPDVHALAAVSYQLLTAAVAHTGALADLAHLQPPASPSDLADLPQGVDDVVLRGLAPNREKRWPDVRSFVNALQATAPERAHTLLISPRTTAEARPATRPRRGRAC